MRVRGRVRKPLRSTNRQLAEVGCDDGDRRVRKRDERSTIPEHSTFRCVAVFVPLGAPAAARDR
jgi:hypothetical protein